MYFNFSSKLCVECEIRSANNRKVNEKKTKKVKYMKK